MALTAVCVCACAHLLNSTACTGSIREPRQNENWTLSPARYGDTYFDGLRSPNELDGGGVGSPTPEVEPTRVGTTHPQVDAASPAIDAFSPPTEPQSPPANNNEIYID